MYVRRFFKTALLVGAAALVLLVGGKPAAAQTITFDDIPTSSLNERFDTLGISNSYLGYQWSASGGGQWAVANVNHRYNQETLTPVSGNAYAWNWGGPQSLFIDFGTNRDVLGASFARGLGPWADGFYNATTMRLFGYDASNNLVASSGVLNLTHNFQFLSAGFTNIRRLEMRAESSDRWYNIDSIEVRPANSTTAVPEPTSALLFLPGLAAFGLMRLRRKKGAMHEKQARPA